MSLYNFIINPKTGRKVSIYNKTGQRVLQHFLISANMGGGAFLTNLLGNPTTEKLKKKTKNMDLKNKARKIANSETSKSIRLEANKVGKEVTKSVSDYAKTKSLTTGDLVKKGQVLTKKVQGSMEKGLNAVLEKGLDNMSEPTLISVCKLCNAEATKKKCTEINELLQKRADEAKKYITDKFQEEEDKIKKNSKN